MRQTLPKIVILLDNILDGETGLNLYRNIQSTQDRFGLCIKWVVVSSTEDEFTIGKYKNEGIEKFIVKPMNI